MWIREFLITLPEIDKIHDANQKLRIGDNNQITIRYNNLLIGNSNPINNNQPIIEPITACEIEMSSNFRRINITVTKAEIDITAPVLRSFTWENSATKTDVPSRLITIPKNKAAAIRNSCR